MTTTDFLWEAAPGGLALSDDEVQVFCASLDVPLKRFAELAQSLSDDERLRAKRFYFERDRRRYMVGRGTLRKILSTLLNANPACLGFAYGQFGKPHLVSPDVGGPLCFNVAHSDSVAVFAIASRELGVDIERLRPVREAEQIAARFFSPREISALHSLTTERRAEAFLNGWTQKEAYLKALGLGLIDRMRQVEVSILPGEPAELLVAPSSASTVPWSLHALTPEANFTGALAVQQSSLRVKFWTWTE